MRIKLVIDGADQRVRITSQDKADKRLLEYVAEWDIARLRVQRNNGAYSDRDITGIDLVLENEPEEDGSIKEVVIPSV